MNKLVITIIAVFTLVTTLIFQELSAQSTISSTKSMENELLEEIQILHNNNRQSRAQVFLQDSIYHYSWGDETEVWDRYIREYFTYNLYGQKIETVNHLFNEDLSQWGNNRKHLWSYEDGGGNMNEFLVKLWNGATTSWENSYKYIYTYNDNDQRIGGSRYVWQANPDQWINDRKDIYELDETGLIIVAVAQQWETDSAKYINVSRNEYSYDNENRITEDVEYSWSYLSQSWLNEDQVTMTYEENKTTTLYQVWNSETNSWTNAQETVLMYDGDEYHWTERQIRKWFDESWRNYSLFYYNYDETDYLVELLRLSWNILGEEWENSVRITTTNDEHGNWLEDLIEFWDMGINEWYNVSLTDLYWSVHESLFLEEFNNPKLICYPNPVSEIATIEYTINTHEHVKIEVANIEGKTIEVLVDTKQSAGSHKIQWKTSDFTPGIYFYTIATPSGISTGKIQVVN